MKVEIPREVYETLVTMSNMHVDMEAKYYLYTEFSENKKKSKRRGSPRRTRDTVLYLNKGHTQARLTEGQHEALQAVMEVATNGGATSKQMGDLIARAKGVPYVDASYYVGALLKSNALTDDPEKAVMI